MWYKIIVITSKNKKILYKNNAFSEYVGSNIFKLTGFETQNTILGKYEYKGKEKIGQLKK